MANTFTKKIMNDGYRNAVVKVDGVLDTSDANLVSVIRPQDFVNNDTANLVFVGFRVDHVWHSIGDGLEMQIAWNGSTPERIMAIAGRGRESFEMDGGIQPNQKNPGYDGSINILTTGWGTAGSQPTQNFTVMLELVKLYTV